MSLPHRLLRTAGFGLCIDRAMTPVGGAGAGIDLNSGAPIVASCGSGMTACILALALDQIDQPLVGSHPNPYLPPCDRGADSSGPWQQ